MREVTHPAMSFLPYGRQLIEEDDIAAVTAVLRGDWLTTGPAVAAFEAAICEVTEARYAIACANGTAALHLAALALDLGPGDRAIVPSVTFLATANAVRLTGAEVVFADCCPHSGLMDNEHLTDALARADGPVKAVMPVHLAGQCTDLAKISALAKAQDLAIIDDAAHAIGSRYLKGNDAAKPIGDGRLTEMTTFSFHPVKTIVMGEGGAVTTNSRELAERLARFRSHGMTRDPEQLRNTALAYDEQGKINPWYYEMPEMGLNYRVTDIQCALGLSQIKKLTRFVTKRRALAEHYDRLLSDFAPLVRPITRSQNCEPAWHLYAVLIDFEAAGISRAALMQQLTAQGIGTQVHYIPVHLQPYYQERYGTISLPGAESYYARTLSLPLFPGMETDDVERVVDALHDCLNV
ncbi:UDP-4-amino-4,6-dideoxy-N-acetyl-beta-L-altrosamine transaminase [Pelagibius litoralis]|uniref:UDP-4-amino-4, 6-dideoxy-N-acetyl-beta-L-altrosamine transaminase n=1 Tax=Pelagibius litoralis TaxID=374515 RepID=A0A967CCG8_9PROT|nr:UDP-4-amino-4,6-dideoxy-N-acetyl-beta-L-altrosamine transaminase [Pelagibius litoralis]NIA69029.1 UDP-4-amino-4,6-dideoxy-N-acetyl-beta-L-altrosamine transaminase [Pelagibius litoralis]